MRSLYFLFSEWRGEKDGGEDGRMVASLCTSVCGHLGRDITEYLLASTAGFLTQPDPGPAAVSFLF